MLTKDKVSRSIVESTFSPIKIRGFFAYHTVANASEATQETVSPSRRIQCHQG